MTKNNEETTKNNLLSNLPIIRRIKAVKELFLEKLDQINQQINEKTHQVNEHIEKLDQRNQQIQQDVEKQFSILTENNLSQLTNAHIKLDIAHKKFDSVHEKIDLLLENNQLVTRVLTDLIAGLLKNDSNAKTYNKIILNKINESLNIHSEQFEYIQLLFQESKTEVEKIKIENEKQNQYQLTVNLAINELKTEIEQQKTFQQEILTILNQNQSLLERSQILNSEDLIMFSSDRNYQKNFQKLRENDIFIASYPRSGNTWVRLLLSDIIMQQQGEKTDTGGNCIPDIYKNDVEAWNNDNRVNQLPFRLIKTHEPYDKKYQKIIFIFRNPADVMTSYYYYQLEHNPEFKNNNQDINIFAKNMINQWCWHTKTYIKAHQNKKVNIQFISYEFMKDNTINTLFKIADFCNLELSSTDCQQAVNNQDFTKLKEVAMQETELGTDAIKQKLGFEEYGEYGKFFRKGKVDSAREELSPETIDYIEEKAMKIYMEAKNIELLS